MFSLSVLCLCLGTWGQTSSDPVPSKYVETTPVEQLVDPQGKGSLLQEPLLPAGAPNFGTSEQSSGHQDALGANEGVASKDTSTAKSLSNPLDLPKHAEDLPLPSVMDVVFLESASASSATPQSSPDHEVQDDIDFGVLMSTMSTTDAVLCIVLVILGVVLGVAGGIGGGGLLLPLLVVVGGIDSKHAVPVSKTIIFGSAVVAFCFNVRDSHPHNPARALIDLELVVMMEPMTLAGTILGVVLNNVIPTGVISILVTFLVLFLSITTWQRAMAMHKAESTAMTAALKEPHITDAVGEGGGTASTPSKEASSPCKADSPTTSCSTLTLEPGETRSPLQRWLEDDAFVSDSEDDDVQPDAVFIERNERRSLIEVLDLPSKEPGALHKAVASTGAETLTNGFHDHPTAPGAGTPWHLLGLVALAEALVVITQLLRRTSLPEDFYVLTMAPVPFLILLTVLAGLAMVRAHSTHTPAECVPGDIHWTPLRSACYPLLCCGAGLMAGLLGIGGGMLKAPLMLQLGILPSVARATSLTMILFTSSSCVLQYMMLGRLTPSVALLTTGAGFVGALCGQVAVDRVIKKYGKASLLVFALSASMFLSLPPMLWITFREIEQSLSELHAS